MSIIKKEGFAYSFETSACESCEGRCCTGASGNIFVSPSEIKSIAKVLKSSEKKVIKNYLHKVGYKYSINEKIVGMSHDCIFYDRSTNGCLVYDARPMQCKTFPFWDYFKTHLDELQHECPGVIFEGNEL